MLARSFCVVSAFWMICLPAATAGEVSLSSLLNEMTDRAALSRFPDPAYTCRQASSYNRAAVARGERGWFSNADWSWFIREETNQGRTEWVMMDAEGPGAIVRWWITGRKFKGTLRIYLDGAATPTFEGNAVDLIGGNTLVGAPLSEVRAKGRNLYLPIPYARRCKITVDTNFWQTKNRDDRIFYQINYRTYEPGTEVESMSMARLTAARGKIDQLKKVLLDPKPVMPQSGVKWKDVEEYSDTKAIEPGCSLRLEIEDPAAVFLLHFQLNAPDPVQALRSTVLIMEFDDEQTVWCPLGDFFGSGVGVNPYTDWYREVGKNGMMSCFWVMPFEKECEIVLENLGEQSVFASVTALTHPWKWDDRSMHFHAAWRQQRDMEVGRKGKTFDWNFVTARGRGVFVGDSLALLNRADQWWGEGDEKIFVDGEPFPSHFGTGTEDYYGYAWSSPDFFEGPFHAQPRCEGPGNFGHTTNTRVRLLDAIPFEKSLEFNMEVLHIKQTTVDYAATTYWYGRPGAKCNIQPAPNEAQQRVKYETN